MAIQIGNLGLVYETRGELDKARAHWTRAVALYKEVGIPAEVEQHQRWIDELDQGQ